ncbi:MAG: bifunctional 4-hydroxy-2-oxoglutarate aldolase/2-dehydro-3-deoxy-phosphogluconate aldolase [Rhodococcus fascians]
MSKHHTLTEIYASGTVLIVRLDDAEKAYEVATAAIRGGIRAVEITLSMRSALRTIERLANEHAGTGAVIGAGTVLDAQQAQSCIDAGATLLVSPNLDRGMIAHANRHQVVTVSGAFTPTEIVDTATAGADIVKLFPAEFHGPAWAKTVLAPLAHIPLMPSGGVRADNVRDWFDAGVACVAAGSAVTKAGDASAVEAAAAKFIRAVEQARAS